MRNLRMSLAISAVLTFCSILPFSLGSVEPWAGYVMMPGVVVGMYASIFISGNAHGVETAPVVIVGGFVNLVFYTIICLVALAIYSKVQSKQH